MIERTKIYLAVLTMCMGISFTSAKPSKMPESGPCQGMNCLHGVLMHDDANQGGDHKTEDQYLRFKAVLKTGEGPPGPQTAEEEFHGVLMHGDTETGHVHNEASQKMLPENKKEIFPKDMDQVVHEGMHGEESVNKHEWDIDENNIDKNKNAGDHEEVMHGLLMHDGESQHEHIQNTADAGEINEENGPIDHDKLMHGLLMHGDEKHEDHDENGEESNSESNENSGPMDHDKIMHGMLMHGNEGYEDEESQSSEEDADDVGPKTADELLHGVMMHGDDEQGLTHDHNTVQVKYVGNTMNRPSSDQLHGILMHGDSEIGHDHSEEDSSSANKPFSDISKIWEMDIDEDILKMIDLEKILKNDIDEYEEWVVNNPEHQDEKTMGSTYIDSSILDDIELMKQRYLEGDDHDTFIPNEDDDMPFTAEDANSVLGEDGIRGEGEDMLHDLELMGNTDPINERHHRHAEFVDVKDKK